MLMLAPLREELHALFAQSNPCRPPALRRADGDDWLFFSDLPLVIEHDRLQAVIRAARERGWTVLETGDGLYADHEIALPVSKELQAPTGEVACVLSLLERHPSNVVDRAALRALAKAEEQGGDKVEKLCGRWHAAFAQRLRNREALPSHLLPYLRAAAK